MRFNYSEIYRRYLNRDYCGETEESFLIEKMCLECLFKEHQLAFDDIKDM